jgi:hypothetical protein
VTDCAGFDVIVQAGGDFFQGDVGGHRISYMVLIWNHNSTISQIVNKRPITRSSKRNHTVRRAHGMENLILTRLDLNTSGEI